MYPYPVNLPSEEIRLLVPILRGQAPPASQAVHACWVLVGYGASQLLPDAPATLLDGPPLKASEVADYLEAADVPPGLAGAVTIPWKQILAALAAILSQWLAS